MYRWICTVRSKYGFHLRGKINLQGGLFVRCTCNSSSTMFIAHTFIIILASFIICKICNFLATKEACKKNISPNINLLKHQALISNKCPSYCFIACCNPLLCLSHTSGGEKTILRSIKPHHLQKVYRSIKPAWTNLDQIIICFSVCVCVRGLLFSSVHLHVRCRHQQQHTKLTESF